MGRDSISQCKTCTAPEKWRDLVQKMRIAGISLMDVAEFVTGKGYPLSHNAVARHELHWDRERATSLVSDGAVPTEEEVTVKTVATHKLKLYWLAKKDVVPSDADSRAWMKLLSDMAQAETEQEKMGYLRALFVQAPRALPAGEVIEGEVLN